MPVPTPVGRIHPNEPRAVMVRDPENQGAPHSAIRGDINIYTDNKKEADYLLEKWPEIVADFADVIDQYILLMPEPEPEPEPKAQVT